MPDTAPITFFYGPRQIFRARYGDITILGHTRLPTPVTEAVWRLNGAAPAPLYVEYDPGPDSPARYPWGTKTPAVNRLRDLPGGFTIELAEDHPALTPGDNHLQVEITGQDGTQAGREMVFTWDPTPLPLPLRASDWAGKSVQEIGQAVDGLWEVEDQVIRPKAPVGHDVLFVVGSRHGSQEATYTVTFGAPLTGIFTGLSDFFVAHDAQEPGLGIKPGYSSAGLITLRPDGQLQAWQSMGDNTWDKPWAWVRRSRPAARPIVPDQPYRVRHQLLFQDGNLLSRCRIWPADGPEPTEWPVSVDTFGLKPGLPRPEAAAFALFQYQGAPTRWSDLELRALEAPITPADRRQRPIEESPYRYVERLSGAARALKRRLKSR